MMLRSNTRRNQDAWPDARAKNPADLIKFYFDLIEVEKGKIEESLASIEEYAEKLRNVASETSQRLITRQR